MAHRRQRGVPTTWSLRRFWPTITIGKKTATSGPSSSGVSKCAKIVTPTLPPMCIWSGPKRLEHIAHYDSIACRHITEPKYIDFGLLGSLRLLESLNELLEAAGWGKYIRIDKPVYERWCWKFMSSIKVNWNLQYKNRPVHIQYSIGLLTRT
ncbi:hypothetical protein Cgig2_004421 [Carnegiea gigantea]|uniref:Uncharacterized protein n=1 Tax=Carnegiea gigantea TaxID=171969 RepID=A0A9Q1Q926_9CARY|nr:hypothetical protein Cgig2_004421 [Carnegiea gigantea]